MIILACSSGNHSNRLFQNIHFEAFCKEYGIDYINPSFSTMHKYYLSPCRLNKGYKGTLFTVPFIAKIMKKLKLIDIISFDNEDENDIEKLLVHLNRNIYVGGWYFRAPELTEKYHDYFVDAYGLKDKYFRNNVLLKKMNELKENGQVVVGIHIRRGDYKCWNGGRFYFDDHVYQKYMQKIKKEIEERYNKKCNFIIFSNEKTSIDVNEYIFKSENKWYIDHFLMSKCDFLIGPPSTFTLWASYMGKIKYFHIEDDSGNISIDDFAQSALF